MPPTSASRWAARCTDVARESAALVITDDNFTSIVGGVRQARGIFDKIWH
jgi:Ca2+-transporting ATPase